MDTGTSSRSASLPISGFVICKNEQDRIAACLRSLSACREIIVIDSGSTDQTLAIVEQLKAEGLPIILLHQPWLGYARQKQVALDHCTQPWCLSLDADEQLDAVLQAALADLVAAGPAVAGWRFRRSLPGLDADMAPGVHAHAILRLVRRGARFDETALVHEGLVVAGPVRTARVGHIRHARRLPVLDQIHKELDYASLKATQRVSRGRKPSLVKLIGNPLIYFFRLFVLQRLFLCGRAGFVTAATGAIYAFATESAHFERMEGAAP